MVLPVRVVELEMLVDIRVRCPTRLQGHIGCNLQVTWLARCGSTKR